MNKREFRDSLVKLQYRNLELRKQELKLAHQRHFLNCTGFRRNENETYKAVKELIQSAKAEVYTDSIYEEITKSLREERNNRENECKPKTEKEVKT